MVQAQNNELQQLKEQMQKLKEQLTEQKEEKPQAKSNENKKNGDFKKKNQWKQNPRQNKSGGNFNLNKFLCFNCLQRGHLAKDCTNPTAILGHMQIVAGGQQPLQATQAAAATTGASMTQTLPNNAPPGWIPGYNMTQASVGEGHQPQVSNQNQTQSLNTTGPSQ